MSPIADATMTRGWPQAFSHIGLVSAARAIAEAQRRGTST
jgi:GH15 family glucan-1,4-alpha-glucosidase